MVLKALKNFIHRIKMCTLCYGMGVRELPNGDTVECLKCKGEGYLK